jgi:hypothetical protein
MSARGGLAVVAVLLAAALALRWLAVPSPGVPVRAAAVPVEFGDGGPEQVELREPAPQVQERVDPPATHPAAEEEPPAQGVLEELRMLDAADLPPDPTQTGPASLTLRLVDAHSGEPLASRVELWRVDAPQNDGWSAGDQLQATVEVTRDGAWLADLPEGRYRAACERAAANQVLPEFELRAPHTSIELALERPLEFELRVHFVDRFGEPYASAEWWEQHVRMLEPASAARRSRSPRVLPGSIWGLSFQHSFAFDFEQPRPRQTVVQSDDGILLGRHRACTRERGLRPVLRLRAPDGALGELEVPALGDGVVRFVVVGLPADVAASRVRLPDGRPSAAAVEALGLALLCADPERDWRSAPVRLKAELEGFQGVELTWSASLGELPWILLEPSR